MILTDSGFWVALGDERDSYHRAANTAFWRWAEEGFATTWAVLAEVSLHPKCPCLTAPRTELRAYDWTRCRSTSRARQ